MYVGEPIGLILLCVRSYFEMQDHLPKEINDYRPIDD